MIPLQVPVVPSHLVRSSWVLSLVQTGSKFPLQGQVLPVGVCHPTSGNLLSGSSVSQGRSLFFAPSTFRRKIQSGGNGGSGASAIPAPGLASTGARMLHAQNRCPSVTRLLIKGCVCMDLKSGYFHVPQLERLEKTFTFADMYKEILTGYHHRDLAASFFLHGFSFLYKFIFP